MGQQLGVPGLWWNEFWMQIKYLKDAFPLWQDRSSCTIYLFLHKILASLNIHFFLPDYTTGGTVSTLESPEATGQSLEKGNRSPQQTLLAKSPRVSICLLAQHGCLLFNHIGFGFVPRGNGLSAVFQEK